jgi:SlyX protein
MSEASRIVDLEVRAAFQDRLIGELNDVVREFARRVERLERELKEIRESADAPDIGPADERPPHY